MRVYKAVELSALSKELIFSELVFAAGVSAGKDRRQVCSSATLSQQGGRDLGQHQPRITLLFWRLSQGSSHENAAFQPRASMHADVPARGRS